jgi:hypothetical protein
MSELTRKLDTSRFDPSAAAALERRQPPTRDDPRRKKEMWARLAQVRPTLRDGEYDFLHKTIGNILIANKRDTREGEDHKSWSYILQDMSPTDDFLRYHPDGTFYNQPLNPEFVIHPAKAVWRNSSKLKILSVQEAGKRTSQWKHLELVHDDYASALGQLRHHAFYGRKRKYIDSFKKLDRKVLTLLTNLADLINGETHRWFANAHPGKSKKPETGKFQRKAVKSLLKDRNLGRVLGFDLHQYWAGVEKFSLPVGALGVPAEMRDKLTWEPLADSATYHIKNGRQYRVPPDLDRAPRDEPTHKTVLSVANLVEKIWTASRDLEYQANKEDITEYNHEISKSVLPFVFKIYSYAHPLHSGLRYQLDWDDERKDFLTPIGKHLNRLHQVAGVVMKYWGQVPFRTNADGSVDRLLDVYENTWKRQEDLADHLSAVRALGVRNAQ